jgi:hypothetical protein
MGCASCLGRDLAVLASIDGFTSSEKNADASLVFALLATIKIHLPSSKLCLVEWIVEKLPDLISSSRGLVIVWPDPPARCAFRGCGMAKWLIPIIGRVEVGSIWSLCHLMALKNRRSVGVLMHRPSPLSLCSCCDRISKDLKKDECSFAVVMPTALLVHCDPLCARVTLRTRA